MAQTKFGAGARVSISRGGGFAAPGGFYRVISVMPREAGPQRYRIKNETENFERVVDESRLEAMLVE
jgi:hypothetical protein